MPIDSNSRIRIADRVRAQRVDESVVIVSMAGSEIFELTGSGVRVWELIEERPTVDGLLERLREEYAGADAEVESDTRRLLGELADSGLIVSA